MNTVVKKRSRSIQWYLFCKVPTVINLSSCSFIANARKESPSMAEQRRARADVPGTEVWSSSSAHLFKIVVI